MANIRFDTLSTRAKRRADMVGSSFVSDEEIKDYLNSSIAELHDFLVKSYEDYFVSTKTYNAPLAEAGADLPTSSDGGGEFYKALGVDFDSGGATSTLKSYSFSDRNIYNTPYTVFDQLARPMYKIEGSKIKLIPNNSQSGTLTLFYVPVAPAFPDTTASNEINFVVPGYAEYVVVATAIRMLMKEESDVSALERERQQLASRIIRAITPRDASGSDSIRDVRKARFRNDFILRY
tara:strand:- start:1178 stop:1882 length:705 start_codon:yes stop_codon:yes gene_type:complete